MEICSFQLSSVCTFRKKNCSCATVRQNAVTVRQQCSVNSTRSLMACSRATASLQSWYACTLCALYFGGSFCVSCDEFLLAQRAQLHRRTHADGTSVQCRPRSIELQWKLGQQRRGRLAAGVSPAADTRAGSGGGGSIMMRAKAVAGAACAGDPNMEGWPGDRPAGRQCPPPLPRHSPPPPLCPAAACTPYTEARGETRRLLPGRVRVIGGAAP
jgi:hypothetical protein